jgi:hypothetical protein
MTITELETAQLRKRNLIAGTLHSVSFIAILLLSNNTSLPVTGTYLADATVLGKYTDPVNLINLNISFMVAAFMALSAFFHFYVASPKVFPRYIDGLAHHINKYRWIEYSLSSSIMIIVIMQLNGVSEYISLLALFGVNVSMILFGWLQERYVTPGSGDLLPFWFGCIAGSVPWIAVVVNIISPKGPSEATTPGFVYGIVISLFLLFNCFAIVQYKQYKAQGKWANYVYGERVYITLSFVAKSLLAWQVFTGALIS